MLQSYQATKLPFWPHESLGGAQFERPRGPLLLPELLVQRGLVQVTQSYNLKVTSYKLNLPVTLQVISHRRTSREVFALSASSFLTRNS